MNEKISKALALLQEIDDMCDKAICDLAVGEFYDQLSGAISLLQEIQETEEQGENDTKTMG